MDAISINEEQRQVLLVKPEKERHYGLDILRWLASVMVLVIHSSNFYYSCEFLSVCPGDGPMWAAALASLARSSVPLFMMLTGYFVLPMKDGASSFLKKRFMRVFLPYAFWCVIYAGYNVFLKNLNWPGFFYALIRIPLNYGTEVGHLWYIQMAIGVDLFIPIITPWLTSSNKEGYLYFLLLWGVSLFLPYLHLIYYYVFGEAFWNAIHTVYYFTGYLGYAVLGQYIRKFHSEKGRWDTLVGFLCFFIGGWLTMAIFVLRIGTAKNVIELELSWGYLTINVAIMSLGYFLIFKNLQITRPRWLKKLIQKLSDTSYGVYLSHIIVLNLFRIVYDKIIPNIGVKILLLTISTFLSCFLVIWLLSLIPFSQYFIG